jgi:hypothetical protein
LSVHDQVVTVTEIATNFGFAELGRFSVEYRKVFGESPSVTLRRGGCAKPPKNAIQMRDPAQGSANSITAPPGQLGSPIVHLQACELTTARHDPGPLVRCGTRVFFDLHLPQWPILHSQQRSWSRYCTASEGGNCNHSADGERLPLNHETT